MCCRNANRQPARNEIQLCPRTRSITRPVDPVASIQRNKLSPGTETNEWLDVHMGDKQATAPFVSREAGGGGGVRPEGRKQQLDNNSQGFVIVAGNTGRPACRGEAASNPRKKLPSVDQTKADKRKRGKGQLRCECRQKMNTTATKSQRQKLWYNQEKKNIAKNVCTKLLTSSQAVQQLFLSRRRTPSCKPVTSR